MVLLSLTAMIRLELPHVNVLTKVDMLASHGALGKFVVLVFLHVISLALRAMMNIFMSDRRL